MRIGSNLFRRSRQTGPGRRRRAGRRAAAPALIETLEDRVLLAATLYQTPLDVDVSTQPARHQRGAQIGMAGDGDFVVLWEDVRDPGTAFEQSDVAFRRFNADGTPKDAQQRYVAQSVLDEENVALAVAGPGGFVAAWQQFNALDGTYDIWYARFNFAGNVLVPPTRANVTTSQHQLNPTVAIADDGTFIIAWQNHSLDSTGDIVFRRFGVNGPIDATERVVAGALFGIEVDPAVAMNSATGDWAITWTQGEFVGSQPTDVWYQVRSAAGTIVVTDRANFTTLRNQGTPGIAMADTGEFVIAWETPVGQPGPERNEIRFRRFTAFGAPVDPTDRVITGAPSLEHGDPVVGINASATRFVIGYEIHDPSTPETARFTAGAVFQVFNGSGARIAGPSAVGGGVPVRDVSIAMDPSGDFVVGYTELSTVAHLNRIGATLVQTLQASEVVVSTGPGTRPAVNVFDMLTGRLTRSFFAFDPGFLGGITVATGDLNNDTFPEIIVGVASGGPPEVRVFDGSSGALIRSFFAFSPGFPGGVTLAVGDVTGDGLVDVVVGAAAGGGPAVRVFNGLTGAQIGATFFAFDIGFRGGVNVATGDTDNDGVDEIIVGAGPGGDPRVRVFNFGGGVPIGDFLAFPLGFTGGVFVSAGDIDEDGDSEIIAGAGAGGGPAVRMFTQSGTQIGNTIFAFPIGFRGGVRVATGDVNGDFETEIIAGAGPGGGPAVRTFDPDTGAMLGNTLFAFPIDFRGGVFVAGRALDTLGEGSPLTLDPSTPPLADSGPALDESDLPAIVDAAQARFSIAGLSPELLAALSGVRFSVTDLGGHLLGRARGGRIYLDDDAAGYGWFVDYSPLLDEEFFGNGSMLTAIDGGAAAGRVDLLTAVLHELGHALGLEHGGGWMSETLATGMRRLPQADELDAFFSEEGLSALS